MGVGVLYMMATMWSPLKLVLMGDLFALAISILIIGLFVSFFSYIKKISLKNGYKSNIKSMVMGKTTISYRDGQQVTKNRIEASKTGFMIALAIITLFVLIEAWGSGQTSTMFNHKVTEQVVKGSAEYQLLEAKAQSGQDTTMAYQNMMIEYKSAKADHIDACERTWSSSKYPTKRTECINGFDMELPKIENISMNNSVDPSVYAKLENKEKESSKMFSFGIIFAMMMVVAFINALDWYFVHLEYLEIKEKLIDPAYTNSLRESFEAETRGDGYVLSVLASANCDLKKANGDLKSAEMIKKAQEAKAEADKILAQIKDKPKTQQTPKNEPIQANSHELGSELVKKEDKPKTQQTPKNEPIQANSHELGSEEIEAKEILDFIRARKENIKVGGIPKPIIPSDSEISQYLATKNINMSSSTVNRRINTQLDVGKIVENGKSIRYLA